MPNKYDLVELIGDAIGAAVSSKVFYKELKSKSLITYIIGDVVYVYVLRYKLLTSLNNSVAVMNPSDNYYKYVVDVNFITNMQTVQDLGGKLVATYALRVLVNLAMNKNVLGGALETLLYNVGGGIIGRGARYVQSEIYDPTSPATGT